MRSTDNPLGAIWRELTRYSGLQRARKLFPATDNEDELRAFCAYVELADSYAALAEDADPSLDPLLLYYAAMWLSRALIASTLGIPVAEKQKAHGSKPQPSADGDLALLGGSCTVQRRGTLPTLIQALGGDEVAGRSFAIIDLLRCLPEMNNVLQETLGVTTTARRVFWNDDDLIKRQGSHRITINGLVLPQDVGRLPISTALESRGAKIAMFSPGAIIWLSGASTEDELGALFMWTAEGYFAETCINDAYLPELSVYLLVLHALSEFTRYYPKEWLDVYSDRGTDHALIREFMQIAERKVPELVLNELSGRRVIYRHA